MPQRTGQSVCMHSGVVRATCDNFFPLSRLADFHMNCQMTSHTVTSCPYDNYIGCLMSYVGLIGSDVTPNYSDNSPTNITISLWCTCRGTGHQEQDCDAFHRDFTHNTCLKNAILSFGYGSEGATPPVTEQPSTFLPPDQPIISKPAPSLHGKPIKPVDTACMFSTCANLQDGGHKCIPSEDYECEETLLAQGSIDSQDSVGPKSRSQQSAPLPQHISVTKLQTGHQVSVMVAVPSFREGSVSVVMVQMDRLTWSLPALYDCPALYDSLQGVIHLR
ncbi:hypothetical protein CCH79_00018142 [Gambusia affinis]|uniref:GDNF/GAS1 domain-containing protein n=1 Tax=Gambusia affinis TaxID=33528 RepID=A0A315VU31_GAMAF|nr:hypothetical protein CCH79_00018142 [Gambusia affinis]